MIDAIKGRARLIRAGILSASVLAFIPILGLVEAGTSSSSATESVVAPPAPTPAPAASTNNYRYIGRDGGNRPRYGDGQGLPPCAQVAPAPSTQTQAPAPSTQAQAPHTGSRGS